MSKAWAQQSGAPKTVQIQVQDGYRYIGSVGVPFRVEFLGASYGIKPQQYGFRMPATPTRSRTITSWEPGWFFGVALDGVPITHNVRFFWEGNEAWPVIDPIHDQLGGSLTLNGAYFYNAVPKELVQKDLSHVGYAADGFPIFVSKGDQFKPSYQLKKGSRPDGDSGPGGVYDGQYMTDYEYVRGSGVLDRCNGVLVKKKYYIYLLTEDFPHLPLCWSGKPDESFADALPAVQAKSGSANGRQIELLRKRRYAP